MVFSFRGSFCSPIRTSCIPSFLSRLPASIFIMAAVTVSPGSISGSIPINASASVSSSLPFKNLCQPILSSMFPAFFRSISSKCSAAWINASFNCSSLTGFRMYSSTSSFNAVLAYSNSSYPDKMMHRVRGSIFRISSRSSRPFIRGISTSVTTISAGSFRNISSASLPLWAIETTVMEISSQSMMQRIPCRINSSSSTNITFFICFLFSTVTILCSP